MGMNLHLKHRIIPIWVVLSCLSLVLAPITASRTHPPLSSIDDPTLPTEKKPPFSQIPTENKAHSPEIKVIHHEDLNMKILVALIIASTLLVGILLFLLCCWIFKQRHLKPLNTNKIPKSQGIFINEVDWLGKLKHQNIVNLLGYCVHDDTRFLVYEMMHQGSLESQLHGPSHGRALTWHRRMQVALDIARGLEYLHERCNPPVIHRDLKSSNILLDSNFTAKISNFALATTELHAKNKVKLSGASGYVAPEYLSEGKLTDKSDVYAFGVVLLELLIGRKPVEKMSPSLYQSIVTWAIPQLTDRSKLPHVVDPVIRDTMDLKHLYQVAAVAVLCVQPEPSYRPLITDVLHSFIPLVPVDLGGSLRT
ncbi:putative protein kinase RLK-Pelle-RLCK-X family [Helianthus annuus]|nr:putative protein kinase RLK-Pelle-RLCK-X family [Helianthus annuus]